MLGIMKLLRFFLIGGVCAVASCERASDKERARALQEAADEFREEARKDLEGDGLNVDTPVDYTKLNEALDRAGESSSGQEKLAMELAKFSLKHMTEIMAPLSAASAGLREALDYSGVEGVEDLDVLSEKVRGYRAVNAEVKVAFGSDLYGVLGDYADKIGLEGKTRADFFEGFKSKFERQGPLLQRVRDLDDELCGTILRQHEILKGAFGKWKWSEDVGGIEISDDGVLAEYNATLEEINRTAAAQEQTQREILNIR